MTEQKQAINNSLPDLAVEVVDTQILVLLSFQIKIEFLVSCYLKTKHVCKQDTQSLVILKLVNWIAARVT